MIDAIRYHRQLSKLRRSMRRIAHAYDADLTKARTEKRGRDAIEEIERTGQWELERIDEEISALMTRRLTGIAARYVLPIPQDGWEHGNQTGQRYLQPEAFATLRKTIRQEQKERIEHVVIWITAVTGLVGSITGLVAVLASK